MRINILGVQFDNITPQQAVEEGVRLATSPGLSYVVTPNPEIVNQARANADYAEILNAADLVLADGVGIIHAGRILGTPFCGRVTGIEFATGLMARMAEQGLRLYLLGAKPGVAELAAQKLQESYPRLLICGTGDGYFDDPQKAAEGIAQSQADVVFVCLGAPKQERFITEFGQTSGAKLMIGLGGVLDVFSGQTRRAPVIMQRMGLEWFYRLITQPSRIGRMIKLPVFLLRALAARGGR